MDDAATGAMPEPALGDAIQTGISADSAAELSDMFGFEEDVPRPRRAGGHREKQRGANRRDSRQVSDAARGAGIEDRAGFGDFIEREKREQGRGPSDNFSYEELQQMAEQYAREGKP